MYSSLILVRFTPSGDGEAALTWLLEDLSPLYVYESKMSLFIRMAQTRLGAERLLEAQLIPTLAQCDFIDCMPEADQAFIGMSFLHSQCNLTYSALPRQ